jgi:hypothetical protein
MTVAKETKLICIICLMDLGLTWVLMATGRFIEGNPIMKFYLSHGLPAFVAAKLFFVAAPLAIAEWYRRFNPKLVSNTLKLTLYAYLGFYCTGLALANLPRIVCWAP